ncbi:cyanase [Alicyclobacillus mali]|uniref:Cyanate hydratase n=1 Tax=Alicyclobacillus mali (ex Roth et al. 2021) TaxID=1123961 RepID=A0ABS0EZS5_9BACL|nr:cyanase [Alicyclobacillus mali (ex Roth et al. 2021)]MBF8376548.1 cyanase [Alicyclobacillus mali (ex Roth et al. 2021)]
MYTRESLIELIRQAKQERKLTWGEIAQHVGVPEIHCTAALLGQGTLQLHQAERAVELLGLPDEAAQMLTVPPYRGGVSMPPTDPVLYRLYEIILVYGPAFKEIVHEKFGDGIMSAIDFEMHVERESNPHGDRVRVIMSGKYLPYRTF